jgi:hypothetical protein
MERQKDEFEEARKALLSDYTNEMERRDKLLAEQSAANKNARRVYEEEVRSKYLFLGRESVRGWVVKAKKMNWVQFKVVQTVSGTHSKKSA